ncbi:MAG: FKBP-type peptidyl-prolyl cis-trans isomerase [Cocleimonas sp.]|nr:FKBP-type peptidyl-prolyl cis-trans isomerase [Cocleimonas sp.]
MKITSFITIPFALSLGLFLPACSDNTSKSEEAEANIISTIKTDSFEKIDVKKGEGAEAKAGQKVSVHYTGWLYKPDAADKHGTKFDSSRDRGQPFVFPLGAGRVIKGWDQGVVGMKVGGQRTLIIPAKMGYGARGAGSKIPPNATLIFDVELIGIK